MQAAQKGPAKPRSLEPTIPFALEAIILRATEIDPARRYPSMSAFANDLEAYVEGRVVDPLTLARAHPVRRLIYRHPKALVAGVLAIVLVIVLLNLMMSSMQRRDQIERAAKVLAPWNLVPRELMPGHLDDARAASETLRRLAADDPLLPLRSAWIPYLVGEFENARGLIGNGVPNESESLGLFRAWLNFLLGRPLDSMETVPASLGANNELSLIDVRGTSRDWSLEAERMRQRLQPPALLRFEEEFLHLIDIPATDATGWTLRTMILAEVIPGDLADGAEHRRLIAAYAAALDEIEAARAENAAAAADTDHTAARAQAPTGPEAA
jgi:hypothetical protein